MNAELLALKTAINQFALANGITREQAFRTALIRIAKAWVTAEGGTLLSVLTKMSSFIGERLQIQYIMRESAKETVLAQQTNTDAVDALIAASPPPEGD